MLLFIHAVVAARDKKGLLLCPCWRRCLRACHNLSDQLTAAELPVCLAFITIRGVTWGGSTFLLCGACLRLSRVVCDIHIHNSNTTLCVFCGWMD